MYVDNQTNLVRYILLVSIFVQYTLTKMSLLQVRRIENSWSSTNNDDSTARLLLF